LLARSQNIKSIGWDDFFIFFSLALSIIAAALVSYSVTLGLGRHSAAVLAEYGTERLEMTQKLQILGFPFNIGSFSFPNISIAILINNILDPYPLHARSIYVMVILQVIFALISVVLIFLQCKPTEKLWNHSVEGKCWDPAIFDDFSYWVSAFTAFTDFALAVVPISVFWKLQMRFSTKLGVCIMMGLTLLSAVVTIVKATYLHLFTDQTDPLWNVAPLVIWGLVEQNVVIVAACIPTLRPFFYKTFGLSKSSRSKSRTKSGSGYKLSSNPIHSSPLRLHSNPGDETKDKDEYAQSSSSQRGIWRTREVTVESDEERDLEGSKFQQVVPVWGQKSAGV